MGIFSKNKKNEDFFEILEQKASAPAPFEVPQKEEKKMPRPDHVLTTDEILSENDVEDTVGSTSDPLASMRERMLKNVAKKETEESKPEPQKELSEADKSLLKRLTPYILDEQGNDASLPKEPLYKLESVADILKTNSEKTLESLSAKYDIIVENAKITPHRETKEEPAKEMPKQPTVEVKVPEKPSNENVVVKPQPPKAAEREQQIFEEILAGLHELDGEESRLPHISDIDNNVIPREETQNVMSDTATVRFTPMRNGAEGEKMSVSTITRSIDLTGEFTDIGSSSFKTDDGHLEQTEFEDFTSQDEYAEPNDAKRLNRRLSVKKRNAFFQCFGSIAVTLIFACFAVPGLGDFMIKNVMAGMIVCTAFLAAVTLINLDMFVSLKNMLSRRSSTDCVAAMAAAVDFSLGMAAIVSKQNEYYMLLLGAVVLCFRALGKFFKTSADLGNFRQIIMPRPKKAAALLTDEATTFSMAKNAIEGDALIAVGRPTVMVGDFMKYTEYSSPLGNRMRVVNVASAFVALMFGIVCGTYFHEAVYGFYGAAVIMMIAAIPTLFFIDNLPVYNAATRLNKKGAMIAGMAAAEHLETANAVVISSRELFPDGTVTMRDMKVLSDNNIDEIIMRAASLTEAANSPLAPIFKRIAGTNKAYTVPDSDTVKYEELRGISGWVENEILFIGNRTLMEAHSIAVPDVEVDRKILRRGYFPVYIATSDKVCALLMVQYNVDAETAHELYRLTSLGVTVLVDNCDPNLTDDMICDYMGLYEGAVKTMSNSGVHMYRNATAPTDRCSAPAAFRGKPLTLFTIVNCAARMKRSNLILTLFYLIITVLGAVIFAYLSLSGSDVPVSGSTVLLSELLAMLLSYLIYLIKKP